MSDFIKFRYTLKPELAVLVNQQVTGYGFDWLFGYLDRAIIGRLKHCSLYLITELETKSGVNVYSNPIAMVAPNDIEAMTYYKDLFHKDNGTILAEIVNRCDNLKVEPVV